MAAPDPTTIGRYEVVSRLGRGGMGSLYLAKDPKIGRRVAIKLVRQEFDTPDARQRFAREAQSAGTLRHPNIVTIFDVDEHEGLPFIAMEYIDGETLAEIVRRKALVPVTKKLQWVEDLCAALAYAHRQGVIHRDIKPANLMVDTEGAVKILDFGLARSDASKMTQSQIIMGTPNYMSPEQIRGDHVDHRSDIFSVGALFYELLAYREAFPGAVHQAMHKILNEEPEALAANVPDVDPAVQQIVSRALAKDPDHRYPDLSLMKNDIADARVGMEAAVSGPATVTLAKEPNPAQGSRSLSSGAVKQFQTELELLQRRREEQIATLLDEVRRWLDKGDLQKAREKCDEALLFDPQHRDGLRLLEGITAEAERKRLEIERAQKIQDTLRHARARFAEEHFEAAARGAAEVLALDAENVAAKEIQRHALDAIDASAARARSGTRLAAAVPKRAGSSLSVPVATAPPAAPHPKDERAADPPERSNTMMFVAAVVGVLVVAGAAGYVAYSGRATDPIKPPPAAGAPDQSQDDNDIRAAHALLAKDDVEGARRIMERVRARNASHPALAAFEKAVEMRAAGKR